MGLVWDIGTNKTRDYYSSSKYKYTQKELERINFLIKEIVENPTESKNHKYIRELNEIANMDKSRIIKNN